MTDNSLKESDAPLSFTSDRFDRDKYAAVAAAAKFRDVRLTKQNYTMKQELYTGLGGLDEPNFAYGGEPREIHFELDDGVLIGSYSWTVNVKLKRKQVLSHKAEFLLIYSNLSEKEPEYFHMYFKKISRFTSYPYFRAIFAANVMNSGVVLPPLPSLTDRVD